MSTANRLQSVQGRLSAEDVFLLEKCVCKVDAISNFIQMKMRLQWIDFCNSMCCIKVLDHMQFSKLITFKNL